ncbi:MAG: hypothetical protein LBQ01_09455 [Prevotellaceae bacterium]|nr:hypothetical protein [Prevotellaceae bacterium]
MFYSPVITVELEQTEIYEGHTYELFFWNDKQWQLFEKQKAVTHFLNFGIPANTLLYLKNITTNRTGK